MKVKKIWLIREDIVRRDRNGERYCRFSLGIQRDELSLCGEALYGPRGKTQAPRGYVRDILEALMLSERITLKELIEHSYPDPKDEPMLVENCIRVRMHRIKQILENIGYGLSHTNHLGYRLEKLS